MPDTYRQTSPAIQRRFRTGHLLRRLERVHNSHHSETRQALLLSAQSLPPHSPPQHNSKDTLSNSNRQDLLHTRDASATSQHPLQRKAGPLHHGLAPSLRNNSSACLETRKGCLSSISQHQRYASNQNSSSLANVTKSSTSQGGAGNAGRREREHHTCTPEERLATGAQRA